MPKRNDPIEGQVTLDEIQETQERADLLRRPTSRIRRARAILALIEQIGLGNKYRGATRFYGDTNPNFDFNKAFGTRISQSGEVRYGKSFDAVLRDGEVAHEKAMTAANQACEICEYADDCGWKGGLYGKLCHPDQSKPRDMLGRRMKAVVDADGMKTMDCKTAITRPNPKKVDWDF